MAYNKTMLNMDEQQLRKALVYDAVQEHRTEQNFHVFEDGQFNYVDARYGFGLSSVFVEQVAQVHNGERTERDGRLMYRFPSRDDASNFVHNIGLLNEHYTNHLRDSLIEKMRKAGIDVNTDWEEGERILNLANENVHEQAQKSGIYSDEFKQWFGDWELPLKQVNIVSAEKDHGFKNFAAARKWAKENISRTYSDIETGNKGIIRISNTAVNKFLADPAPSLSTSLDVHFSVLKVLPSVIKDSIIGEIHADANKINDVRKFEYGINPNNEITRLYGAVRIDEDYYRVKVTLKRDITNKEPFGAYSYEATSIEVLKEDIKENRAMAGHTEAAVTASRFSNSSISAAKLLKDVEKSHLPGEKLLDNSQILTEKGEPMVFYHGTNVGFDEFDLSKSAGMAMFTSSEELAKTFAGRWPMYDKDGNLVTDENGDYKKDGYVMPVYLNVRNPKIIDMDGYDWFGNGVGENAGKSINKGRKTNFSYLEAKKAQKEGYDGLILRDVTDGKVKSDHVIVFNANQIKSVQNVGTYRLDSNNIYEHRVVSDPVINGVIANFAKKYHLPIDAVRDYYEGMGSEDFRQAQQAYYAIRRAYKVNLKTDLGEAYKLSAFSKNFAELKNKLYNVFGDVDALRDREVQKTQEYQNMMDTARREAEKRVQAEYERLQPYRDMSDAELDELYMQTLPHEASESHSISEKQTAIDNLSNDQKALLSDLLTVMQERRGYTGTSVYQGQGAWVAPGNPGYASDEERRAKALDDSSDVNIEDIAKGITPQPEDYFSNLRAYGHDTKQGTESARAIRDAIETIQNTGEVPMVRVYRAVPKDIQEGMFRNGDWVTMSSEYAKIHGELRFGIDNYRVIRHDVPANQLWWDGNDINEWGFDDGKDYQYKNTLNNRKSNDLVTFDDKGNVIPLSNRFDDRKADIRFFRSGERQAYGFVYNGTIYIDPRIATAETPLHEYTHLWAEVLRQRNPQEWQNIVRMMKDTPEVWNYVIQNYPHLKTDDQIADETLAQFSGKRGYRKLQELVDGKQDADTIIGKMMEALAKFWNHVAEFFGIHYTNKEEVADRILYDLLNEVNPLDYRITAPAVNVENPAVLGENPFARIAADKAFYENFFREQQEKQIESDNFKEWFGDWQKSSIYRAYMVDDVAGLKDRYPSELPNKFYDHSTVTYGLQALDDREGQQKRMHIIGRLTTEKVDVLVVDNPESYNEYAHITLATAAGVKPIDSNTELEKHAADIVPLDDYVDVTFKNVLNRRLSKVVDADGKPLVVEHGTHADFTVFDINKIGENSKDNGLFGAGFYFGTTAPGWLNSDKGSIAKAIKLHGVEELRGIFAKAEPDANDVAVLQRWLREHKNDSIVLYHGTDVSLPISQEGLKKTSARTARSLQSGTGNVYLTPYPTYAKAFGQFAYPEKEDSIAVYDVAVKVSDLRPDKDQLKNKRMAGVDLGDSLAASLLVGHSATVKHHIMNYDLQQHSNYHVMKVYLDIKHPFEVADNLQHDIYGEIRDKMDSPAMRGLTVKGFNDNEIQVGALIEHIKAVDDLIKNSPDEVNKLIAEDAELQYYHSDDRERLWRSREIAKRSGIGSIAMSWQVLISDQIGSYMFTAAAIQDGYDGVIVDRGEGYKEYVVFDPSQIKSATDNIGLFSKENNDIRYHFIGEQGAQNLDNNTGSNAMDMLHQAKLLADAGASAKDIKIVTGWERGADNQWRYEITAIKDFNIRGNVEWFSRHPELTRYLDLLHKENAYAFCVDGAQPLTADEQNEIDALRKMDVVRYYDPRHTMKNPDSLTLKDYMDAPQLYAAYPELKDMKVTLADLPAGNGGSLVTSEDWLGENVSEYIRINKESMRLARDLYSVSARNQVFNTFKHEVQHAIQHIEGFALGGSPGQKIMLKGAALQRAQEELSSIENNVDYKAWQEADKEYRIVFDKLQAVMQHENRNYSALVDLTEQERTAKRQAYMLYSVDVKHMDERAAVIREQIENGIVLTYENYRNLVGEVEARNVVKRSHMTEQQRHESLAADTEDISRDEQIVKDVLDVFDVAAEVVPMNVFKADAGYKNSLALQQEVESVGSRGKVIAGYEDPETDEYVFVGNSADILSRYQGSFGKLLYCDDMSRSSEFRVPMSDGKQSDKFDILTANLLPKGYSFAIVGKERVQELLDYPEVAVSVPEHKPAQPAIEQQPVQAVALPKVTSAVQLNLFADSQEAVEQSETKVGNDLSKLTLPALADGEHCYVERRYTESGAFSFVGGEHIETSDDVAYIFKSLADKSVENSFICMVKDGVPTVIHLGIGSSVAVMAPIEQALVAYAELKPDKIWFIHNHPSGSLKVSRDDINLQRRMVEIFGGVTQPGIVINTTSGKFVTYTHNAGELEEAQISTLDNANTPVKVWSFDRQVFSKDWNPEESFKAESAFRVAMFVSSHRFGEHDKLNLLVINQNSNVTGNIFLPWTDIKDACTPDGVALIARYVQQMGGTGCFLYGSDNAMIKRETKSMNYLSAHLNQYSVNLCDVMSVANDNYYIAHEQGILTPYASERSVVMEAAAEEQAVSPENFKPGDIIITLPDSTGARKVGRVDKVDDKLLHYTVSNGYIMVGQSANLESANDWRLATDEEKAAFLAEEQRVLATESGQEQQRRQSQSYVAPRRLTLQDREAGGAMVEHLQAMGITVSTDNRENRRVLKDAQKDQSEAGKVRHFKTEQGQSYGFAYKGEIHLDLRKIDAELPLHEYAHLWCESLRRINPDNWNAVVQMMKQDADTWKFVKTAYPELSDDNDLAEEVIAHYSGKRGAAKLQAELERMTPKDANYGSRWGNIFQNVSKAIQDFWKHVGDSLNFHYESKEDLADQILNDFAKQVNPVKKVEKWLAERDKEYAAAVEAGDIDKARDLLWQALTECVGNGVTPFMAVDGYRGKLDRLAREIKEEDNTEAIEKAAGMMEQFVRAGAVLVPAPGHDGHATYTLELANAIGKLANVPVADVLKCAPHERQYDVKKATGTPISAEDLGVYMDGELPEDRIPVVIDNVVHSGNTAEACVKALGKGYVLSLASATSQERHVASLKRADPVAYDKKGQIIPLSERFELKNKWLGRVMNYKPIEQSPVIAGLESYSEEEIAKYVREHFEAMLEGSDIDARIIGIKVIGSRVEGNSDENSDLDVLLEFEGSHVSEDALFNILNDEEEGRLYIEGIPVDINPITASKSGTIKEFLERNKDYHKETDKNYKNDIDMKETDKKEAKDVRVTLDVTGLSEESAHSVKVHGDNVNVTLADGIGKVSMEEISRLAVSFGGETRFEGDERQIIMPDLAAAEQFAGRLKYWDNVRGDTTYEGMSVDFGIRHMVFVAAGAYGVTRVLPNMQPNKLAEDILKLWHGDRNILNGLTVKDYFVEVFRQLNDMDAPLHKELRQQWDDLERYSGGHLREAAWMMAYPLEDKAVDRVLAYGDAEHLSQKDAAERSSFQNERYAIMESLKDFGLTHHPILLDKEFTLKDEDGDVLPVVAVMYNGKSLTCYPSQNDAFDEGAGIYPNKSIDFDEMPLDVQRSVQQQLVTLLSDESNKIVDLVDVVRLPEYAVGVVVNGDRDVDLEEEDMQNIDDFLEQYKGYAISPRMDQLSFESNPAFGQAVQCYMTDITRVITLSELRQERIRKQEESTHVTKYYGKNGYDCRQIVLPTTGESVLVGSTALEDVLMDEEHSGYIDEAARILDEKIFYYVSENEIKLPSEALAALVEREALDVENEVTVSDDEEYVVLKDSEGDDITYRHIRGWTHDDPALIYSDTDVSVYFYDSKAKTVENIDNEAGIDAYEHREGFFLVEASEYNEAYWQLQEHDREQGFEKSPLDEKEMSLMSQYVQDQQTGNHLLGRERPEGYHDLLLEMTQTHEALWNMSLLNERQRNLLIAESMQYQGGVDELAEELNVDRDYLVAIFVDEQAAKMVKPVRGEVQVMLDDLLKQQLSIPGSSVRISHVPVRVGDVKMEAYNIENETVSDRTRFYVDVISGEGDIRVSIDVINDKESLRQLAFALQEQKILADYQKENLLDAPMFLIHPVDYEYQDAEGKTVHETLTAYSVDEGQVMLYDGMYSAGENLSPVMLSDLPLKERLSVSSEILSNLQGATFKKVEPQVTPTSERVAFMEGIFVKYDRQEAGLDAHLGDFQTMKETPDIWINGMYDYMTGEERQQFLDLVEKDDRINEFSKAAILSRRFLLNGEMDVEEFRLQQFLFKTFGGQEYELNFNIPLKLEDADERPFEANGIKMTETDGQMGFVVEIDRDKEIPLHSFGYYDDLHRRVLAELILDNITLKDARAMELLKDTLDEVNVAPAASRVRETMEGVSVSDNGMLQVHFVDEHHKMERVLSGEDLVTELDVPFLTALFDTTGKLAGIAMDAAKEEREQLKADDLAPIYMVYFEGNKDDIRYAVHGVGKESDGEYRDFMARYQLTHPLSGMTLNEDGLVFDHISDAVFFQEDLQTLLDSPKAKEQFEAFAKSSKETYLASLLNGEGMSEDEIRSVQERITADIAAVGKAVEQQPTVIRKEPLLYSISYGTFPGLNDIAGDIHVDFGQNINAVGFREIKQMAEEMGGDARTTYEHTWADFFCEADAVLFAEKIVALNQERLDAAQNDLDFRIAQMAPIYPVPATETMPVRYGIHGLVQKSEDEDYDTDLSSFINEYHAKYRDTNTYVYGYKFGFIFNDQKDALQFHSMMTDYIQAIGRDDVLFRLEYQTKKKYLYDNLIAGPTREQFDMGQLRLAEGTYMKEADGSDTQLSEREWLASVTPEEKVRFHLIGKGDKSDKQEQNTEGYYRRPVRFHFIGVKGATNLDVNLGDNNISFLQHAKNLDGLGRSAESIKLDTGWEKGTDGQWRMEIASPKSFDIYGNVQWKKEHPEILRYLELNVKATAHGFGFGDPLTDDEQKEHDFLCESEIVKSYTTGRKTMKSGRLTVQDYIDAPMLFMAYPTVKDMPVEVRSLDEGIRAQLHIEDKILSLDDGDRTYSIYLNKALVEEAKGLSVAAKRQIFGSIAHELQHFIQETEGFALGANHEMFRDEKGAVLGDLYDATDHQLFKGGNIQTSADLKRNLEFNIGGYPLSYYYADRIKAVAEEYGFGTMESMVDAWEKLPEARKQYLYTAGEVEARNVVQRLDMTLDERRRSLAFATEDVPRVLQNVSYVHGIAFDAVRTPEETVKWLISGDETFRLQMFGRIATGIGDDNLQWAKNTEDNFLYLKEIWKSLPEDGKPSGYTLESIENWEKRMTAAEQKPLTRQEEMVRYLLTFDVDHRAMLLGRMRSDVEYYLNNGTAYGYSDGNLWAGNFEDHLTYMKALYDSLPEHRQPENLTVEKIEGYRSKYNMRPPLKDGIYKVDIKLRKEDVGYAMAGWFGSLTLARPSIQEIEVRDGRVQAFRGDYGLGQAPGLLGVNDLSKEGAESLYDSVRNQNVHEKSVMGIVMERMKEAGIEIYADKGLAYSQMTLSKENRYLLMSGGGAYGIVRPDGTIFIDTDKATAETPIHEYTHLWAEVLRQKDPEEWKAIVKMMLDTPQWQEVRQKYPHLQMSDDIAEEVLAHYSGARGHERLMASFGLKEDQGYEQLNDEQKGIFTRISEALARFWERVMTLMQVPHYTSKEQVADQILFDLMNRVNPLKMKGAPAANLSNGIIRPHFIGEQGAKNITMTSRSFLLDLLQFAKDSADKGMDPAKIKLVSGWEQGTDGKWRYEVGNTKVKNMEIKDGTTLGVVVDAPEIFRAYPELKDIKVILGAISDNAHYNNDTKTITLNEFYTKREVTKEQIMRIQVVNEREIADSEKKIATGEDVDAQQRRLQELLNTRAVLNGQIVSSRSISDIWPDINKVIDHEVQHAIQHIEGFAVGGSLRTVADMRLAKAEALMAQYEDVYNEYKELEYRFMNEEDHEMVMDYYDAKVKFEREHGAEINAYVVARLQRDKAEMDIVSGMLNENNFEEYRRLAGEVEARNVSERRGMSVMERRHSLASSTEDISREEQIIVDSSKESVAASIERQLPSEKIPYTAEQSAVVTEGIIFSLTEHNGMYLNVEGMDIVALFSAYEIQDRTSALTAAREVSTNLLHSAEEKEAGILERLLPVGMTLEQEAERMAGEAVFVGEQLYDCRKNNLRQMIDDRISGLNGLVEKANDLARKEDPEYVMKKHITGYDLSVKSENVVMLAALMGDDQKFVTSWTDSRSILDKLDSIEKEIIQRYPGLAELAASHEVRLPEEKEGVSDNLVVLSSIDDIENRPMEKNQSSQGVTTSAFSMKDEEVPGYSPAAYGSSAEVWENSMNNLVRLTVRTIKDLYNPSAYSESYDSLRDLLWGNPNDSVSTPIVDRLRGDDISGVFTTNEFYNTFEHWCKYYGSSENHTSSYGQLRDNDDFMKDLLNKVEQRFVDEYGLKVAAKEEKQENKVVLHKIEGIDTHPMEKIVVTMLNLPEQRITVDLYGYDGSVHGLDVTGGVIQGGVLTFADGSTTDLDYMIGTTLESQLGKTLADQIESMDMSDTVEHPIVDKGAAIWDFYAEQIGFGLDSELRDKLNVLIPESGNRLVLNVPISTTLLGKEFGERNIVGFVNNNGYFSAQTDKGESADIDRLVISGLVASHKQIDGQHYTCEVKESEKKGENQEVRFPKDIHILRNDLEVALNKFADEQGANIPISSRVWKGQYNSWSDVEKVAALAVEDVLRAVGKGDSNLENSPSSQYVSQKAEQYAREITEGVKAGIAAARSTEKYFAFGQEVPQETIDELRADGVTDFSTENLEKLLHFEAQDNDVPTEDVDFREGMSERVWQKLNEILPENGDKIVLSEPFTITKAEGYAVDRAQEVKEIVRAMSPEYDTDVFVCGDELGGINTFRMVYDDLARVENIIDGEKYTVELQEKSARNDEFREERGYLMDVISEALHDMNGHVEIPHTELPSIPLKGEWAGEGDGHAYMEIITGEHNISDAVFHDVHAETYPIDEVVGKLGSSEIYELTVAVRKAQIANFVGAGNETSFVNGLPVSRDEPGTLKDFVDMVKFDKEGNLQIIGYRLDDEGNHISLDEVGGLELSGYDDLYASVKEIREQERLDDIEQEAVEEKPAEVVNAPKDETQEKKSAEKEATKKDLSKRHEAYKDYRIPEGLLIDKGNVFKLDSGKDAGKYAVYALVNGKKHFTPMEPDNKEHMKDLSYFFACVKNGERNTALNNLLAKYIGEKRQSVAIHEEKPKEKDKPVPAVERQRNLLAYALGEALKDGILANRRMMVAPSLLGSDKPVSGFNMLLMALHAQAKDYATSQYVEYKSATAMGFSVSHNQQALPFDWYNWNKFVNKTNEHDIIDEAKYKSLDKEEQGLYEAMRNKRVLNVFNLGQTNYAAVKKENYEKAVSGQSDAIIFKPIGKKGAVEEGMQTLLSAVKGAYPDHLVLMKKDEGYALYASDAIRGGDILQKDVVLSKTRFDEDGDAVNEILITAEELPEVIDKLSEVANVTLCEKEDCQVSSNLYERIDAIYAEMDHIGKALELADGNHVMVNPTLETDYNRETDNLIINNDRQGVVGMEYETAVARLNEAYRQIAAYVGSAQRLDREASQNLLPADAAEYDRLVQELSAAVLMVRQGLPATVSEVNKTLLEYWKRELKETPSIVAQLENDIDNTVGVVDKIRKGEDVNYTAIRGRDRFVMDAGNTYSITQELNTRPSEQDRSVVVIRHDSSHVADVILPRGASKEVSNEADGMRKNSIILALHKEGYGQVRFYNAGGSLSLKEANDYYRDRKVDVCTLAGTTLIVKENVDLAEKLAESSKVRILFADMIKAGEKSYALYIKPENQDSIVVFPDPRDITRFFSVAEHDRDRLDGVRQSLGRKYYNIVQKHPEFKADILMPKEVDVDMNRLSNVNIRKDRQTQGWMLFADIDNVHQKPLPIDQIQAQHFWLVDDKEMYKLRLAASMFQEKLGLGEGRDSAQFRTSEEGRGSGSVSESSKEGGKDHLNEEEVRTGVRLK